MKGSGKRHKKKQKKSNAAALRLLLPCMASILLALNLYAIVQSFNQLKSNGFEQRFVTQESIKITLDSLSDLTLHLSHGNVTATATTINTTTNTTMKEARKGKGPLLQLLRDAGIIDIDIEVIQLLPTWQQVEQLYGNKGPIIEGQSQCKSFRNSMAGKNKEEHASLGIAGMFDSGTNLAATYLEANCILSTSEGGGHNKGGGNNGIRWQVPWGKHVLAKKRKDHLIQNNALDGEVNPASVLPVILIRDPYYWMQSLCRHNYGAQWLHDTNGGHCPNLVPNAVDYKIYHFPQGNIPVRIKYDYGLEKWDSLAHLWSDWYQQYYQDADYPRLLVRYEDFLFYPKQVTQQICECVGGTLRSDFYYATDSAKHGPGHGSARTSWVSAMIRYGSGVRRFHNLTDSDLALARRVLDSKLMQTFLYTQPEDEGVGMQ